MQKVDGVPDGFTGSGQQTGTSAEQTIIAQSQHHQQFLGMKRCYTIISLIIEQKDTLRSYMFCIARLMQYLIFIMQIKNKKMCKIYLHGRFKISCNASVVKTEANCSVRHALESRIMLRDCGEFLKWQDLKISTKRCLSTPPSPPSR